MASPISLRLPVVIGATLLLLVLITLLTSSTKLGSSSFQSLIKGVKHQPADSTAVALQSPSQLSSSRISLPSLYSSSFQSPTNTSQRHDAAPTLSTSPLPSSSVPPASDWRFVVERDGDNYGLTDEQCETAFPKLYSEIEKSVARRASNPITFEELDSRKMGANTVRGLVYNGDVTFLDALWEHGKHVHPCHGILHSLNRALIAAPNRRELPNVEFIFTTEDIANGPHPIWAYSKKEEQDFAWLMPDFGYWSWPEVKVGSYGKIRQLIKEFDDGVMVDGQRQGGLGFDAKEKKLIWRGNIRTAPDVRGSLVAAVKGREWADVMALDWGSKKDIRKHLLPMEDHCRYMFVAHTEGRSFSGRGKYLQNCRSVFIAHKLQWKEAHHAALESSGPDANFVEVSRDFSDLEQTIEHLIAHPDKARRIAENGVRTFRDRYLTPAAEACYWRRLIREWRSVSFEPQFYKDANKKEWRGVPFESFVLMGSLKWEPH